MSKQIMCAKCHSNNIEIRTETTGSVTKTKRKGIIFSIMRLLLIICTCGLWLIFGKKSSKSKTTNIMETIATCQTCGNSWIIK